MRIVRKMNMRNTLSHRAHRLVALAIIVAIASSVTYAQEPPQKKSVDRYLRLVQLEDGGQLLQTSVLSFTNDKGVQVELIGAIHIADAEYYDTLNTMFKRYDKLLYEMVKPLEAPDATTRPANRQGGLNWVRGIQQGLKDLLELEYQLEGIDYKAANFVHADMDLETFQKRQAARGEGFMQLLMKSYRAELQRQRTGGPQPKQPSLMDMLGAARSPDRANAFKRMLAPMFTDADTLLQVMDGDGGSVILTERNRKAMEVLDRVLKEGNTNVAIFYGAAHLKGMEEILVNEMGFRPLIEPSWITAWKIPPAAESGTTRPAN
jgi:hypothetical protein